MTVNSHFTTEKAIESIDADKDWNFNGNANRFIDIRLHIYITRSLPAIFSEVLPITVWNSIWIEAAKINFSIWNGDRNVGNQAMKRQLEITKTDQQKLQNTLYRVASKKTPINLNLIIHMAFYEILGNTCSRRPTAGAYLGFSWGGVEIFLM